MENTVNLKSSIAWSDFKLNSDGMVPVIAQDYQTNEVLMLAYMNEEAFNTTLETGKMTYWSRSRNELWTKGLTSGHLQRNQNFHQYFQDYKDRSQYRLLLVFPD